MLKGKYPIVLPAVAAISFVLAFFGYYEILVLVVAYALLCERDNWLIKQTLQALYLGLSVGAVLTVLGWVFSFVNVPSWTDMTGFYSFTANVHGVLNGIANIFLLVFALMGLLKVIKGEDANLPIFGDLADKSMGIIKPKPVYTPPVPPVAPPVQPNQQPAPFVQAPPMGAPVPSDWHCPKCGKVNSGKFCAGCGTQNPNA